MCRKKHLQRTSSPHPFIRIRSTFRTITLQNLTYFTKTGRRVALPYHGAAGSGEKRVFTRLPPILQLWEKLFSKVIQIIIYCSNNTSPRKSFHRAGRLREATVMLCTGKQVHPFCRSCFTEYPFSHRQQFYAWKVCSNGNFLAVFQCYQWVIASVLSSSFRNAQREFSTVLLSNGLFRNGTHC